MNYPKAFFLLVALLWTAALFADVTAQPAPAFAFSPQASTDLAPYAVELADMDGDGDQDFVTSNVVDQESSTVSVSKNNGDGTFAAPVHYSVGPAPTALRLADFNGDGKPDVVCIAALSGTHVNDLNSYATVLLNNGTGGLVDRHDYSVGENAHSGGVDVGDYNGDGLLDFAIATYMNGFYVYRNTGNGTFTLWAHTGQSMGPDHIASADFNGDGRLDLIVGNTDAVQIFLNNGSGFTTSLYYDNYPDAVWGVAVADFDNNGQADFALSGRSLSVYRTSAKGPALPRRPSSPVRTRQGSRRLIWTVMEALISPSPITSPTPSRFIQTMAPVTLSIDETGASVSRRTIMPSRT